MIPPSIHPCNPCAAWWGRHWRTAAPSMLPLLLGSVRRCMCNMCTYVSTTGVYMVDTPVLARNLQHTHENAAPGRRYVQYIRMHMVHHSSMVIPYNMQCNVLAVHAYCHTCARARVYIMCTRRMYTGLRRTSLNCTRGRACRARARCNVGLPCVGTCVPHRYRININWGRHRAQLQELCV